MLLVYMTPLASPPLSLQCSDGGLSRVTNSDYNVKSVIEPSMLQIGNPPLFLLDGVQ